MEEIEHLYTRYKKDVYGYLISLTRDPTLSEDLMSDTFVRAMTSIQSFQGRSSVKTWLFAIARNAWLQYLRKNKQRDEDIDLYELYVFENMEERLMTNEAIQKIEQLLLQKDERTKKIVQMRVEGYSFAEIAKETKLSESSARVIDFRTKKWLRAALEKEGFN